MKKSVKAASLAQAPATNRRRRTPKIDPRTAAYIAANAAESKKGHDTLILEVGQVTVLADFFVVTGGSSAAQTRAIVDAVEAELAKVGMIPHSIEGKKEGRWVLMDYDQIMVHVLLDNARTYYRLEQFWNHALVVSRNEWLEDV